MVCLIRQVQIDAAWKSYISKNEAYWLHSFKENPQFILYKDIFFKNIEAEFCEILI